MKKQFLTASAAIALAANGGLAFADDEGWYVRADLGSVLSGILDTDPATSTAGSIAERSDVRTGFGAWIGGGYEFGDGLRLESTFGYRASDTDVSSEFLGSPQTAVGPLGPLSEDGSAQVWDAMVNLLYDVPIESPLTPYVGGGVGLQTNTTTDIRCQRAFNR
ncbi:MAG: outer membrane beta-barrel protein, partial [Pseudomonadota bacterium]